MGKHRGRRKVKTVFFDGIAVREVRPGYYLADFMRDQKRVRKGFGSIEDARAWCGVKAVEARNHGTAALAFCDKDRIEYRDAVKALAGRVTLAEAVRFWIEKHPAGEVECWERAATRYLCEMRKSNRRSVSVEDKEVRFDVLNTVLNDAPPLTLDKADIVAAVKTLTEARGWSELTASKYEKVGLTLLRFVRGEGKRMHRQDEAPPATWSADQIRAMMHQAESVAPGSVAALAVMTFAGIRPAEALRLTWNMIDIERKTISLMGDVTKTRTTRHVDIPPNLLQWLSRYRGEGLLVRSAGGFRGDRERIMQALGIDEWPNDVLRHTAATMMYAKSGDVNHVCQQLGHVGGSGMFLKHYRGLAPKPAEVQAFWDIVNQA